MQRAASLGNVGKNPLKSAILGIWLVVALAGPSTAWALDVKILSPSEGEHIHPRIEDVFVRAEVFWSNEQLDHVEIHVDSEQVATQSTTELLALSEGQPQGQVDDPSRDGTGSPEQDIPPDSLNAMSGSVLVRCDIDSEKLNAGWHTVTVKALLSDGGEARGQVQFHVTALHASRSHSVCLVVTHIKFDHKGPDKNVTDGLNILKKKSEDLAHKGNGVGDGEWILAPARNEQALYVADETVTIKARFKVSPPGPTSAKVKADGKKLMDVKETSITLDATTGISVPPYVELDLVQKTPKRISKIVDSWKWRVTELDGSKVKQAMNTSGPHTVYVVLDVPKAPWYSTTSTHPWVKGLEFAIETAGTKGQKSLHKATAIVTKYLHTGHGMSYDTVNGDPAFTSGLSGGTLNLTGYIDKTSTTVNCYDQAGAVTALSRLLGATTAYKYMTKFGYIHPAKLVGVGKCNNPFFNDPAYPTAPLVGKNDVTRSYFHRHAFAELNGKVFNAAVGPYLGKRTEAKYIEKAIDKSKPAEAAEAGDTSHITGGNITDLD